jgi:hypothetical protein
MLLPMVQSFEHFDSNDQKGVLIRFAETFFGNEESKEEKI